MGIEHISKDFIINFGKRAVNISDEDAKFYIDNGYVLGFFKESEIFHKHNLLASREAWNLPKLEETVLIEDNEGHFYTAYLDHQEWKDLSENKFDWFNASDGNYFTDLDDETIIAWYKIPAV